MDDPVRIYIVEDHPVVRRMLAEFIERERGLAVGGAAGSGEEALDDPAVFEADVVLVDLSLPGINGAELVTALKAEVPALRCLMLSGHSEECQLPVFSTQSKLEVGGKERRSAGARYPSAR